MRAAGKGEDFDDDLRETETTSRGTIRWWFLLASFLFRRRFSVVDSDDDADYDGHEGEGNDGEDVRDDRGHDDGGDGDKADVDDGGGVDGHDGWRSKGGRDEDGVGVTRIRDDDGRR